MEISKMLHHTQNFFSVEKKKTISHRTSIHMKYLREGKHYAYNEKSGRMRAEPYTALFGVKRP